MTKNVIISTDDKYEFGKSYDEKTNEFLGDYIRFIGEFNRNTLDFSDKDQYPLYGVPMNQREDFKPSEDYLAVIKKYPQKN